MGAISQETTERASRQMRSRRARGWGCGGRGTSPLRMPAGCSACHPWLRFPSLRSVHELAVSHLVNSDPTAF
jgi:hypothetical protein